jgi:hypothetical protein
MAGQDFRRFDNDTAAVVTDVQGGRIWVKPEGNPYKWCVNTNALVEGTAKDLEPVPVGDAKRAWLSVDTQRGLFIVYVDSTPVCEGYLRDKAEAKLAEVKQQLAKAKDDWQVTEPDGREVVGSARKFAEPMTLRKV